MTANDSDSARLAAQGPGLLTALRRYAALVVICIVVAAVLGVLVTFLLPRHYSADAQLVLGDDNGNRIYSTTPNLNATAKAQNAAQVARSKAVHDRAAQILDKRLGSSKIGNSVTASPGETGNPLVTITATEDSAKLARDAANAVGQAYLDIVRDQKLAQGKQKLAALQAPVSGLQTELGTITDQASARHATVSNSASKITNPSDRAKYVQSALDSDPQYQSLLKQADDLTSNIATLQQKIEQVRVDNTAQSRIDVDTLYKASTPSDPLAGDLKRNAAIAAALGLLIGAALAWRRMDRDRGVDEEQVSEVLGAPPLAALGRERELRTATRIIDLSPGRALSDDLRALSATLLLHARRRGLSGIVVTSAEQGEGKTALALNLAAAAHSAGQDVVLVDGDVRSATLTDAFELTGTPGLSDVVAGRPVGDVLARIGYGGGRTLPVIPVGSRPDAPVGGLPVLASPGSAPAAIVDSPAVFLDSAALLLASGGAGLVVLVSRATTPDDLRTLRSRAALVDAPILGFVTTEHRPSRKKSTNEGARHGAREDDTAALAGADTAAIPGR